MRHQGRAVAAAVVVWGLAITGFGLTRFLPAALALLAVAGGADVISAVFRGTILPPSVPDALRGRLTGIASALLLVSLLPGFRRQQAGASPGVQTGVSRESRPQERPNRVKWS